MLGRLLRVGLAQRASISRSKTCHGRDGRREGLTQAIAQIDAILAEEAVRQASREAQPIDRQ